MSKKAKIAGNSVALKTFELYGVSKDIGFKVNEDNQVVKIWCKTCARHSEKIRSRLKGKAYAEKYIVGTNYVTKHNIFRHLNEGNCHQIALELERIRNATLDSPSSSQASDTADANGNGKVKSPKAKVSFFGWSFY